MENINKMIEHYGSQERWAEAWGVSASAVSQWVASEQIPTTRLLKNLRGLDRYFTAVIDGGHVVLVAKGDANE